MVKKQKTKSEEFEDLRNSLENFKQELYRPIYQYIVLPFDRFIKWLGW